MARTFSLEQALPPPVISLDFLRNIETELQHTTNNAGYRFAKYQFGITDGVGTETFDAVTDDAVPLRLAQFHSVQFLLQSEEESLKISLDFENLGGEALLRVQMSGNHAREDALQLAARIRQMVIATNAGAPGDQQPRFYFKGLQLPSVEFSSATVKALKETIVRLCASYCDIDPGIIRVETLITLEKGTTVQNATTADLERTGFPPDTKALNLKCECTGGRHSAIVELEFGRERLDTWAHIMGMGEAAEEFALGTYREITRTLQKMHTNHKLLFIGQQFIGPLFLSGFVMFFFADSASDDEMPYARWLWIVTVGLIGAPFLANLVPYTQFDNPATKNRVKVVNWLLVSIAGCALAAAVEPIFKS